MKNKSKNKIQKNGNNLNATNQFRTDTKNNIKREHKVTEIMKYKNNNSTNYVQNNNQKKEKNYVISYSNPQNDSDEISIDLSPRQRINSDNTVDLMDDLINKTNNKNHYFKDIEASSPKNESHHEISLKSNNSIIDLTCNNDNSSQNVICIGDSPVKKKFPDFEKMEKETKIQINIEESDNKSKKTRAREEKKEPEPGEFGVLDLDFISFEKKQNIIENKDEKFIPWISEQTKNSKGMLKLHYEIIDFYNFLKPTDHENHLRKNAVKYLKNLIKEINPSWKCKTFGSFSNQLHLPESDIDIVVIAETNSTSGQQELRVLKKIANKLVEEQKLEYIKIIEAKVPIIRATFKGTKINVDISANRKNGYAAKKVIRRILECFPFLRPLIYLLKFFLKQRNLNETYTGGMSSFLLFNLILSYVQVKKKELINESEDDISLGHLLCGFFQHYCCDFNYEVVGISVKYGGYFFKKIDRNWYDENRTYLLCVENFQDPDQDIGKSCFKIKKVLDTFKSAKECLFFPSSYPIDSYLKSFIHIDKFLLNRYNELQKVKNKKY
jgi:non-canonical poly(A) RNA polymerase PAPD5/7